MSSSNISAFMLEGSHLDVEHKHNVATNPLVSHRDIILILHDIESHSYVLHLQIEGVMPESGPHMAIYF